MEGGDGQGRPGAGGLLRAEDDGGIEEGAGAAEEGGPRVGEPSLGRAEQEGEAEEGDGGADEGAGGAALAEHPGGGEGEQEGREVVGEDGDGEGAALDGGEEEGGVGGIGEPHHPEREGGAAIRQGLAAQDEGGGQGHDAQGEQGALGAGEPGGPQEEGPAPPEGGSRRDHDEVSHVDSTPSGAGDPEAARRLVESGPSDEDGGHLADAGRKVEGPVGVATVCSMSTLSLGASERRPLSSWLKLGIGGAGLSLCGLWWLLVLAMLLLPDPVREEQPASAQVLLIVISVLATALFLVIFRSGLRGSSVPSAAPCAPRADFLLEAKSEAAIKPGRPPLRLVRPEP